MNFSYHTATYSHNLFTLPVPQTGLLPARGYLLFLLKSLAANHFLTGSSYNFRAR